MPGKRDGEGSWVEEMGNEGYVIGRWGDREGERGNRERERRIGEHRERNGTGWGQ